MMNFRCKERLNKLLQIATAILKYLLGLKMLTIQLRAE